MFEDIIAGMGMVFQWDNMLSALVGVTVGMIMGSIPGLTENMAMCLFIPFTLYLKPIPAIAMLMGLSKGGNFGGSIPAILFNMPGTPQAAATCFDGYPLSRQGKSGKALRVALFSSCMADIMSDLVLFFLAAPVAAIALMVGPPEYTVIVLFSLVIIGVTGSENLLKGMIAIGLGLLLAVIGLDPVSSAPRFTFGSVELTAGVGVVPLVIGLLIVAESFRQIEAGVRKAPSQHRGKDKVVQAPESEDPNHHRFTFVEFKRCLPRIFSGTAIGSAMGIIPGIGSTPAAFLSYGFAKRASRHPEDFGKGSLEGLAACEAGNNAVVGPNLIPLVTLGIPGNLAAALILGGFMMQGLTPGPLFMQRNAPMLYALFIVLIISNAFTFTIGNVLIRFAKQLTQVPKQILFPMVMIFAVIGSYVFRSSLFDVTSMCLFGILGYVLMKFEIPLAPLVVAFILGQLLEDRLRQALVISRGTISIFFTRPIALAFILLTIAVIVIYIYRFAKVVRK
jgi:putative tricarboxylic transport membrane protein